MKCTVCGREQKGTSTGTPEVCECQVNSTVMMYGCIEPQNPIDIPDLPWKWPGTVPNTKEDLLREISKKLDKIIWLLTPKKKRKK